MYTPYNGENEPRGTREFEDQLLCPDCGFLGFVTVGATEWGSFEDQEWTCPFCGEAHVDTVSVFEDDCYD